MNLPEMLAHLSEKPPTWGNDEDLLTVAGQHVGYLRSTDGDYIDEDLVICDLINRLQQEKARNELLVEKVAVVEEAWDMLHFGCDNPDHKEAYLHAATAFLTKGTN